MNVFVYKELVSLIVTLHDNTHCRIIFAVNNSSHSQVSAVAKEMSNVTVQPMSDPELDEEEYEDDDEEDDEEWAWHSTAGDLTKRYNRAGPNSQVCRSLINLIFDNHLFLTLPFYYRWSDQ